MRGFLVSLVQWVLNYWDDWVQKKFPDNRNPGNFWYYNLQNRNTDNRGITTGGPSIVPFYVPEKSAVMQNSTMQDTVCRGILNGTMQGIYSIKDSTMQGF